MAVQLILFMDTMPGMSIQARVILFFGITLVRVIQQEVQMFLLAQVVVLKTYRVGKILLLVQEVVGLILRAVLTLFLASFLDTVLQLAQIIHF